MAAMLRWEKKKPHLVKISPNKDSAVELQYLNAPRFKQSCSAQIYLFDAPFPNKSPLPDANK